MNKAEKKLTLTDVVYEHVKATKTLSDGFEQISNRQINILDRVVGLINKLYKLIGAILLLVLLIYMIVLGPYIIPFLVLIYNYLSSLYINSDAGAKLNAIIGISVLIITFYVGRKSASNPKIL